MLCPTRLLWFSWYSVSWCTIAAGQVDKIINGFNLIETNKSYTSRIIDDRTASSFNLFAVCGWG